MSEASIPPLNEEGTARLQPDHDFEVGKIVAWLRANGKVMKVSFFGTVTIFKKPLPPWETIGLN